MLLSQGANVNMLGGKYGTAIHAAIMYGNPQSLQGIMGKRAELRLRNERGQTASELTSEFEASIGNSIGEKGRKTDTGDLRSCRK